MPEVNAKAIVHNENTSPRIHPLTVYHYDIHNKAIKRVVIRVRQESCQECNFQLARMKTQLADKHVNTQTNPVSYLAPSRDELITEQNKKTVLAMGNNERTLEEAHARHDRFGYLAAVNLDDKIDYVLLVIEAEYKTKPTLCGCFMPAR